MTACRWARAPACTSRSGRGWSRGMGRRRATLPPSWPIHFVHGQDTPRALQYLQQAAQNARRRHAHHEVLAHCTSGLALLAALPETPERTRHELALQVLLAPALVATQGYAAPDVERTYTPGARPLSGPGRSPGAVRRPVRASRLAWRPWAVSDRPRIGGTVTPHGPAAARSGVAAGSAHRAGQPPGDPRRAGGGLRPPGNRAHALQPVPSTAPMSTAMARTQPSSAGTF